MNAPSTLNTAAFEAPRRAGIEGLFDELAGIYGKQFADKWEAIDPVTIKRAWVKGLKGYTPEEIQTGLEACYHSKFAPNLPDFLERCRPVAVSDDETLFLQACNCALRRKNREPENWSSNRLFWAYQRIGPEILGERTRDLKKRFAVAYLEAEWDANKPIPQPVEALALPPVGKTSVSKEEAIRHTDLARQAMNVGRSTQYTAWAYAIAKDPKTVPTMSVEKAIKAFIAWNIAIPQALIDFAKQKGLEQFLPELAA